MDGLSNRDREDALDSNAGSLGSMENAPQLAVALEDFLPLVNAAVALDAGPLVLHKPKDVSAEASKGVRRRGQSRAGSMGKGQGRKGRGTQGCITFRRSSRPTLGDEKSGEKRLSSKALIESPEARAAQGHLLEAMVQRAHPVVQAFTICTNEEAGLSE